MTKTIVILFSSFEDMDYTESYQRFATFARNRDIDVRFVFGVEHFTKNQFTSYWKFEENRWNKYSNVQPFTPNIVYLRSRVKIPDISKRVNNTFLENICRDKYLTYTTFPDSVKKTGIITPSNISVLKSLQTELVALKPRFGANGRDVEVLEKNMITKQMIEKEEYIVQELIDSSAGIPGLVDKKHELRVFVFNGDIRAAYLRIPADNSYIANISRGAKEQLISLTDIPQSTTHLIQSVDKIFSNISSRLYTVDIMYEDNKPWIVEMNDTPGMPDIAVQPFTDDYYNTLLDFLASS